MTDGRCETCHWWFDANRSKATGKRVCVWHSGLNGTNGAKVAFGGNSPLTTRPDFGCVDWQNDERESTLTQKEGDP